MANNVIYSNYFKQAIIFKTTPSMTMHSHPANYDHLATGIMPPDYACTNCTCYGFPCVNCSVYVYDGNIIPPRSSKKEIEDKKEWTICFGDFDGIVIPKFNSVNKMRKNDSKKEESYDDIIKGRNWADVSDDEL